jgi:hypothetical protein
MTESRLFGLSILPNGIHRRDTVGEINTTSVLKNGTHLDDARSLLLLPVGTRENPGGASKGVKPPEAPWFLGISTSLEACKFSVFHPLIVRFSAK